MAAHTPAVKINSIWMLTREYAGLAEAGGVKDVCRQLAEALARAGKTVTVVLPLYGFLDPVGQGLSHDGPAFSVQMDYVGRRRRETVSIWTTVRNGVRLCLLDSDRYREKHAVYAYTAAEEAIDPLLHHGSGHVDYFAMNLLLQKAALALMIHQQARPNIIHCQDGHTAILPAMIREIEGYRHYFRNSGVLVTIHNAGQGYHQDVDDLPYARAVCDLPIQTIQANRLNGAFNPFLAASGYAILNTVSENYARELQETDDDLLTGGLGHRLLEKGVRLEGVTNGINPADFDPSRPATLGLPVGFAPGKGDLAGKTRCRQELCRQLAGVVPAEVARAGTLDWQPDVPLFTMISRLMVQKGVDILIKALRQLLVADDRFQVVILGTGTREIEMALVKLAGSADFQGRICLWRDYDPKLANLIYAAGDFFLAPSRYEPCGLTDYLAQLAGNLPIVHHVGGLVKVRDGVTGFAFQEHSAPALMAAMQRAMRLYREQPEAIRTMQVEAVRLIDAEYTWDKVMSRYLRLYRSAVLMARASA